MPSLVGVSQVLEESWPEEILEELPEGLAKIQVHSRTEAWSRQETKFSKRV
jgi:hypothetical protein